MNPQSIINAHLSVYLQCYYNQHTMWTLTFANLQQTPHIEHPACSGGVQFLQCHQLSHAQDFHGRQSNDPIGPAVDKILSLG